MLAIQTCYIESKMHSEIGKGVLNSHLASNIDPFYIQNRVIRRYHFSLTVIVLGVSNKHCLLPFFMRV